MTNHEIKTIRLVFGALELEAAQREIPSEYVGEVQAARAELALMRGTEVVDAVAGCLRAGLPLALKLQSSVLRVTGETSSPPSHRRLG